MTSRPGPGIQESLQHRAGAGPPRAPVRRPPPPSKPANNPQHAPSQDCVDPALEDQRRPSDETLPKARGLSNPPKARPVHLENIRTSSNDAPRPPPRGRPQIFYTNLSHEAHSAPPHATPILGTNLPIPPRPGASSHGDLQQHRIIPGGTGTKGDVAPKPSSADIPIPAVTFPGGKTADLFPWTGNHPEDTLSEALVKGGISNKAQIMNETNTARPSLWSNLKNKSGLGTLSTLFVHVLEKRQSTGRLTAPNSFKPPPRLTLRDSTREAWLYDLANPTVGLRRLSRTIPHGITGKVLLEQCLNKNIPVPRAVWLAKCVGINEMRSHKRKGQAGTITWVKGWTTSVTQFLDSVIATIGQQDWKPRITYALQLSTQLYKEDLLETEHFLDWVLKNLDASVSERLFLWLLVSSLFWTDIVSSRRRGKRLAESLLTHASKLPQLDEGAQASPVTELLERAIFRLLVTSPMCFLLPRTWAKHTHILRSVVPKYPQSQLNRIISVLDRRNRRLLHTSQDKPASTPDSTPRVYALLDSVDYQKGVRIETLASECMKFLADGRGLVSTVLQWASTIYRDGSHRVYLATRLLRRWSSLGIDIDDAILKYLHSLKADASNDPKNVFRVIAELVRSKNFSVGKYLQWLIATGSLSGNHDLASPSSWPLRLITEIPLSGLPEQVRNLRSTLLRGTVNCIEVEERALDDAEDVVRQQIPTLFGTEMIDDNASELKMPNLSSTVKLELAMLLRQQVIANVETIERVPTKDPTVEEPGPVCMISPQDFHAVRNYIEQFGDFSILADVIGVVATSLDAHVLASAADTLHYHFKTFNAIGAFTPLFQKIAMRYVAIRTARFPERELLISLSELARTAGAEGNLMQALAYDFSRYEQKNSLAACSPVSDTMADTIHSTAVDSDEEIDRILSSGTSMDHQIMGRVLGKIMVNLDEQMNKSCSPSGNHAIWLHRLRTFDENAFEGIMADWLRSQLMTRQVQLIHASLRALVTSGSLTLSRFLKLSDICANKQTAVNPEMGLRMRLDTLDYLLPTDNLNPLCPVQEAYRYRLEQQKFCYDPEGGVLNLIRETLEVASAQASSARQGLVTSFLSSDRLRVAVKHFAVNNAQLLSKSFGIGTPSSSESMHSCMKTLLDGLLDPGNRLNLSQQSLKQQIHTIVENANYLSLPFCQLELRQMFSTGISSLGNPDDNFSAALLEAVKSAVDRNQTSWCDLVSGLDADLTSKIREHAEREILNASSFLVTSAGHDLDRSDTDDKAFVQKYLTVINVTASDQPSDNAVPGLPALVDRLKGVAEALTRSTNVLKKEGRAGTVPSSLSSLCCWLSALLRLALVHSVVPLHKYPNQVQAALLWNLRSLFTHPVLHGLPSLTEYIFDVAVIFSDSTSDEVRNHLGRMDVARSVGDARCAFVFGSAPPPDGWLALARPVVNPMVSQQSQSQATPSPQPLSQQSNATQSPQHSQSQPLQSPSPASLQRSLSQQSQQQQIQAHNQNRTHQYPQQSQQSKMLAQFQRMSSGSGQSMQQSQLQQMQQMQQMQGLAQQRNTQPSPVHMQRQMTGSPQPGPVQTGVGRLGKHERPEMKTMPFSLKRWEILPESGGNPAGNETAVSLSLFGARKV